MKFFRKFKMGYGVFYVICPGPPVNMLRHWNVCHVCLTNLYGSVIYVNVCLCNVSLCLCV